jgi:hypothetical protein
MGGAQRMRKPGVLGTGKGQAGQPKLSDPSESLDLGRPQERDDNRFFIVLERDESVDRIAEKHGATLPEPAHLRSHK